MQYKRTKKEIVLGIIIYGSLIIILIWALLKGFGAFNTPALVEILPVIMGVIAGVGTIYKFGQDIGFLKSESIITNRGLDKVELSLDKAGLRLANLESKA